MRPAWTPAECPLLPSGTISTEGREEALGQRCWQRQVWCSAFLVSRLSLWHQPLTHERPTLEPGLGNASLRAQIRATALNDVQDLTGWKPYGISCFPLPIALPLLPGDSVRQLVFPHGVGQCPHRPDSVILSLVVKVG